MEETVMGLYKINKLTVPVLKAVLEPYRGTDIDSGGSADLKAKNGLEVPDIVIKLLDPKTFKKLEPMRLAVMKHPKDYKKRTEEQELLQEKYYEARYEAFHKITKKTFGWC